MLILISLIIILFCSFTLINNRPLRYIIGSIAALLTAAHILAITFNLYNHYGMKKETVTETHQIYTAGDQKSPANILIANEIGSDSHNFALVYRDHKDADSTAHNKPSKDKIKIMENSKKTARYQYTTNDKAYVTIKKTYYVYQSDFYKMMLSFGQDKIFNHQDIKASVPEDSWVVLSADDTKTMKNKMKQPTAAEQQQVKKQMMTKAAKYQKQHPHATQKEIQQYTKKLQTKYAVEQIRSAIK